MSLPTITELESLRDHMKQIAMRMQVYGKDTELEVKGGELMGASYIMNSWIESIKEDENLNCKMM